MATHPDVLLKESTVNTSLFVSDTCTDIRSILMGLLINELQRCERQAVEQVHNQLGHIVLLLCTAEPVQPNAADAGAGRNLGERDGTRQNNHEFRYVFVSVGGWVSLSIFYKYG